MSRPSATVVGSGVIGMSCALTLADKFDVTIVARDMPGDPLSKGWASPWAGAMWLGLDGATPEQARWQLESYKRWIALADNVPEAGVKRIDIYDYQDEHTCAENNDGLWYTNLPKFRMLRSDEVKHGIGMGMFYETIVVNPTVFLPWARKQCEKAGIKFVRKEVASLREAAAIAPCDVVVNASGNGARLLVDVHDSTCQVVRGQTILVRTSAKEIHMRHGKDYTYIIPRGDGTAILGGIKEFFDIEPAPKEWLRQSIHRRCHELLPEHIPEKFEDLDIVTDLVGFRPEREEGVRVEKELRDGLKIVHAYGVTGGGYVYSWGVAGGVKALALASVTENASEDGMRARL